MGDEKEVENEIENDTNIELSDLMKLQDAFGASGELNENDFVQSFGTILNGQLDKRELIYLFMKIDANSDGHIDWDEFTNYMFLHSQNSSDIVVIEANDKFMACEGLFAASNGTTFSLKENIFTILEKDNQYLTVCHDGSIKQWHATTLKQTHAFEGTTSSGNYVTSVAYMPLSNRMAVASMKNSVVFFDLSCKEKRIVCKIPIVDFKHATPLCLSYYIEKTTGLEVLLVGDDTGSVFLYTFSDRFWHLCDGTLSCHDTHYSKHVTHTKMHKHTDHVTQVEFIPALNCLVTSSLDATLKVIDLDRKRIRRDFRQHKKAVYSFVWCEVAKAIASVGLERVILLWSPYSIRVVARLSGHVSSITKIIVAKDMLISLSTLGIVKVWDPRNYKAMQTISGDSTHDRDIIKSMHYDATNHRLVLASRKISYWPIFSPFDTSVVTHDSAVVETLYNPSFFQVVSIDAESKLAIWDVTTGKLLSRFLVKTLDDPEVTTACFDVGGRRLLTGGHCGNELKVWNFNNGSLLKHLVKKKFESAYDRILARNMENIHTMKLKDTILQHITRPEHLSSVCIEDGLPTQVFACKGTTSTVKDISVHNDSALMKLFQKTTRGASSHPTGGNEVTKILCIEHMNILSRGQQAESFRFIVSVGWDRRIYVWQDDSSQNELGTEYHLSMPLKSSGHIIGHQDDINTVAFCPPNVIATGGDDGKVILWCLNSGRLIQQFQTDGPVRIMKYLSQWKLMLALQTNGDMIFIDPIHHTIFATARDKHKEILEEIIVLKSNAINDIIVTGSHKGYIQVYEMSYPNKASCLNALCRWRAHEALSALDYVEIPSTLETFLLTGSSRGDVTLFTLTGKTIGHFGQTIPWDIYLPNTYVSTQQPLENKMVHYSVEIRKYAVTFEQQQNSVKVLGARRGVSNENRTKRTPGKMEVWLKYDTNGVLSNVLSVAYTNRMKGHIEGYNGILEEKRPATLLTESMSTISVNEHMMAVPLPEFGSQHGRQPWVYDDTLSRYVGRIFQPSSGEPFKILYIAFINKTYFAIDTTGKTQTLPQRQEAKQATSSLSLHHFMEKKERWRRETARKSKMQLCGKLTMDGFSSKLSTMREPEKIKELSIANQVAVSKRSILSSLLRSPAKLKVGNPTIINPHRNNVCLNSNGDDRKVYAIESIVSTDYKSMRAKLHTRFKKK